MKKITKFANGPVTHHDNRHNCPAGHSVTKLAVSLSRITLCKKNAPDLRWLLVQHHLGKITQKMPLAPSPAKMGGHPCEMLGVILHGDDDISRFLPCFNIAVSLGNLFQRVVLIDNRLQLSRLHQLFEEKQILIFWVGSPE